jgi:hypothetical protein
VVRQRNAQNYFVERFHEVAVQELEVPKSFSEDFTNESKHLNVVRLHSRLRIWVVSGSLGRLDEQGHVLIENVLTQVAQPLFKQPASVNAVLALELNCHLAAPLL